MFLTISLNAQSKKSKSDDSCKLTFKHDDFENIDSYSTGGSFSKNNMQSFKIHKDIYRSKEISMVYCIFDIGGKGCVVEKKTQVRLLLKNGEQLIIPYKGSISCGRSFIGVLLNKENIEILINNPIAKIRLDFSDNLVDSDIDEKYASNFIEQLKCLDSKN